MTREDLFEIWAPSAGVWSPWAKPVLFAHTPMSRVSEALSDEDHAVLAGDVEWAPAANTGVAFVLDLPGATGVHMGLALAERGYRPVPLYNAAPGPAFSPSVRPSSVVSVWPIIEAICDDTMRLRKLRLPADAPPVFLLDAMRRIGERAPSPSIFDNRSISFPTDFPSANRLLSAGIQRVWVVQANEYAPQPDLAHTLRRWEGAGIELIFKRLDEPGGGVARQLGKPSRLRELADRFAAIFRFRRNALGGFGGMVPEPSSGGSRGFGSFG